MRTTKAVVFDLDGVLTDTAKYHYLAWKNMASQIGIEIDEEFNEQLKGVSRIDSLIRILEHGNKLGAYSSDEINRLANEKNEEYKVLIEDITSADLLPGIEAFLEELKEAGIQLAIGSASKNAPVILEKLGIRDYFAYIVDVNHIVNGKPAPDIFLDAIQGLGVPALEAIGVEDAEAGIEALEKAGIRSIGIGVTGDVTLASTAELRISLLP
ncbi:beta-phosphoglucomutase [Paenibacillus sp. N1-5-1-14]|uniref:beta-phosphoglucomutase n=1 Tax=Paenibacillus radicibacter TaxID=2972488 RepID=UPI002159740B|nr:beta-phosphoglucomutase [Paenibacillus radicibacter]MCR8643467.1 beta-phosphoglucomutase [Paenibacillus radicibacter]